MKKYHVHLTRTVVEQAIVTIMADDPDVVDDLAIDIAEQDTGNLEWEPVEIGYPAALKTTEVTDE